MKSLKIVSLTLLMLAALAPQKAQAGIISTVIDTASQGAQCLGATASTALEAWQALPASAQTCAKVVAALVAYHNYADFLNNEAKRREELYNDIVHRRLPLASAQSRALRCRNKFCPVLASKSVLAAIDTFYKEGSQTDLQNALCPGWKPLWMINRYF